MDILTQGLLGATTFALVKEKHIGKKALLIGGIAGLMPDFDVLLAPIFNEIEFLTVHRSVSHSLLFAVIMSLFLGFVFQRKFGQAHSLKGWVFAFFLAIFSHALLDWFTTYGTKLFSPISGHMFSLNSIHVFEPLYSVILLIGVIALLVKSDDSRYRTTILTLTFTLSTIYLGSTYVSKTHAYYHFKSELAKQELEYERILVSPTPLNSLLWHGIVKSESGYYFATYSILDKRKDIEFQFVASHNKLIPEMEKSRLVKFYLDYTQDFPLIKKDENGKVKVYAIKYGPINYFGVPEFVYPLTFDGVNFSEHSVKVDHSGKERGPVKNYANLFRRIKGI
ncbi:MAG: inner membrane protein [Bacteroidia bacterium]|jgi:inner membrane protein